MHNFINNMLELCNVYRVQFKKREPILIAGFSFSDALERLEKDKELCPADDPIISVSLQNPSIFV